jgi:hypothetical protein
VILATEAEAGILTEVRKIVRCSKPFAATAEKSVRYLLGLQAVNRFTAVTVLRK